MSPKFGPHVQMSKLAQQMALGYRSDKSLALAPFLKHFMDEVEVNVASDKFDHTGFMTRILEAVEAAANSSTDTRVTEFLVAVASALGKRIQLEGRINKQKR